MTACVIFNPAAGRGRAQRLVRQLRRQSGRTIDLHPTGGPGHAAEIAERAASEGCTTVIAAGGDGTVHEVANGLLRAARPGVVFGVWPIGSANDYAFALGIRGNWPLRRDPFRKLQALPVDVGRLSGGGQTCYFVNGIGLGFNGAVTYESRRIRRLRGMALYGAAFLAAVVRHFKSPPLDVTVDGREERLKTLAFTVNIGKREGGFLVTPRALLADGLFDYVHAGPLTRWQALTMLPRMATGTLPADNPLIRQGRCRNVSVRSEAPLRLHADGELVFQPEAEVREILVEMLPAALRVLRPA